MPRDPKEPLPTARRELFAVLVAANPGGNRTDAFRRAGYARNSTDTVASTNATLTAQKPEVRERIDYLTGRTEAELEDALRAAQARLEAKPPDGGRTPAPPTAAPSETPLQTLQWCVDASARLVEIAKTRGAAHPMKRALGALSATSDSLSRYRERMREAAEIRARQRADAAAQIDPAPYRFVDNVRALHGLLPAVYPDPEPAPVPAADPPDADLDDNWAVIIRTARSTVESTLARPIPFIDVVAACDAVEAAARAARQAAAHVLRAPAPEVPAEAEPPPISASDLDLIVQTLAPLAAAIRTPEDRDAYRVSCPS